MLDGARFGAIVSGLPLFAYVVATLADAQFHFRDLRGGNLGGDAWMWLGWPVVKALLVLLACAAMSASMFAAAALLSRESSHEESAAELAARQRQLKRREIRSKSIIGLTVVGLVVLLAGLMLLVQGGMIIARTSGGINNYLGGMGLIVAGLAVLAGLRHLVRAGIRGLPTGRDWGRHAVFDTTPSERPFDERLAQFTEEQVTTAAQSGEGRHWPVAFYSASRPGVRRGPKSAGSIRRVLRHIRYLLRGD